MRDKQNAGDIVGPDACFDVIAGIILNYAGIPRDQFSS